MMSPTQRSLKKLRDDGYTVAIVEHWNPFCKRRVDLFNFADLLCMSASQGFLAVQTTSGSNLSARVLKIKQEPKAAIFLASGGKIVVHGWRKVGPRGKLKKWQCREEWIENARIVGDSGNACKICSYPISRDSEYCGECANGDA